MCGGAHGAGHAHARVDAEQRLEEFALSCDRLVYPREHVTDVAQRVMRVQIDRSCAGAARSAPGRQGAREGREERGLARLREYGEGLAGWAEWAELVKMSRSVRREQRTQGAQGASGGGVRPRSVRRELRERRRDPSHGIRR